MSLPTKFDLYIKQKHLNKTKTRFNFFFIYIFKNGK